MFPMKKMNSGEIDHYCDEVCQVHQVQNHLQTFPKDGRESIVLTMSWGQQDLHGQVSWRW
jgi:hypothetical protein